MKRSVGKPGKARAIGRAAALAAATVVALAACSSDPSAEGGDDAPLKVVAVTTAAEMMLPFVAEQQGLFEEEGVDVEVVPFTSGTKVQIPKILNGDFDIGWGGMADLIPTASEGGLLKVLQGTGSVGNGDMETSSQVYFTNNPDIQSPRDLEGRTVGTQVIGGGQEAQLRGAVAEDGGDPSKVEVISIPAQNTLHAVETGQIDAGQGIEPFLSEARSRGMLDTFSTSLATEGLPEAVTFTATRTTQDRPEDVAAYIRAMERAAKMANENPELIREVVREYTEIDPGQVDNIRGFGRYNEGLPPEKYQEYADFMVANGALAEAPPLQEWLYTPSS